ncbi:SMP-30/gluconolactonase/LRE family protein [Massilia endophytica]|uniref:SMP-30/gluconolactonase/LRE family protein n=1 Tax=Massilia endophytica TaxID=2899220 RepID=UPI001E3460FB|nr:SMP-30/gluconolactonase/LRE family protein [Massilia endophytica]UGQ49154.1 SMP-30/gluconolactonase/LRE family protein [Massilia endophytica]
MNKEFQAACIWQAGAELGEGPLWARQRLYFVDIKGQRLLAYEPSSDHNFSWSFPDYVCWIVPRADGDGFMAGLRTSVVRLWLEPELRMEPIASQPELPPNCRLNDAKADPYGNLWFGSMNNIDKKRPDGHLWRLAPDGSLTLQDEGICICNGPAFSLDGRTMYHADSMTNELFAYPVDASGICGERRLFRLLGGEEGSPDGMTVDSEGGLWLAQWGGARVCRYLPDGTLDMTIRVPVSQPASCAFGGPDLRTLYITSAYEDLPSEVRAQEPLAGSLFAVTLPMAGRPADTFGQP